MIKNNPSNTKDRLHPNNRHRERYPFETLVKVHPALAPFFQSNLYGDQSIDFADPLAVKALNTALLMHYYRVQNWEIPEGYLCPPVPGRADYIHYAAELLGRYNYGKIPQGPGIKCLDIGVGANCIYPIIGHFEYGWSFIGSDIDPVSIESATRIMSHNPELKSALSLRLQTNPMDLFYSILNPGETVDLSICNPPFHASAAEAQTETLRKQSNLKKKKVLNATLNFGGQASELCCPGGEEKFIRSMVLQSRQFMDSCFWFTSLVAKKSHLKGIYEVLRQVKATEVKTIPMGQGNKSSRILAWTFLSREQQNLWRDKRWTASVKRSESVI